jgi:hypothetical protein
MIDAKDFDTYYQTDPQFLPAEVLQREVKSRHIKSVSYDTYKRSMFIEFINGDRHMFAGVPISVFNEFLTAESKGKYFKRKIENAYPHLKIPKN